MYTTVDLYNTFGTSTVTDPLKFVIGYSDIHLSTYIHAPYLHLYHNTYIYIHIIYCNVSYQYPIIHIYILHYITIYIFIYNHIYIDP